MKKNTIGINKEKKMKKKKKTQSPKSMEYEFCKICKINHNQGRRHNFIPRHTNSLSSVFTRFTNKLSRVKSSLKNPNFSHSSPDRIWCIFCDSDIDESSSVFVCGGAIEHLASEDHLKNLKNFLWKYGGGGGRGGNKVDLFRISEDEFAKWKKRCEALKKEAPSPSEIFCGSSHGQSNDIQTNSEIINNFNSNNTYFFESSSSKDVLPLQYDTNENYQVYLSDISQDGRSGFLCNIASNVHVAREHGLETSSLTCQSRQQPLTSSSTSVLADGIVKTGCQGFQRSIAGMEPINEGYHNITRILSGGSVDMKGNVHSGALPPWLEGFEAFNEHEQSRKSRVNGAQTNTRKTSKLNPKRVGAAWAEKRKFEMEMEKAGESVANVSDVDWLPNFGRVWQSGSRKESMKEFKKEKSNLPKAESQVESEFRFQPYVSKRMRHDTNANCNVQKTGDIS